MKTSLTRCGLILASIFCLTLAACDNKKEEITSTTKQHADAGIQTIKNMQSAYEGEKNATAKYLVFSKKAEEEGYHNIALLYNAVSASESIHAANIISTMKARFLIGLFLWAIFKKTKNRNKLMLRWKRS